MNKKPQQLSVAVDNAVVKYRYAYSIIAKKFDISYNEMLVLYTLRENGCCTQKQICESYFAPKQTINNVITNMKNRGYLQQSSGLSIGREKVLVLTDCGKQFADSFFETLKIVEKKTVAAMGAENVEKLAQLLYQFDNQLLCSLKEMEDEEDG
mgnify:CR=1 FL=1